tara:strand:+ start:1116 stop:1562 length:447 start_codon:yes stop_codon:yes gene_type:complete
MKIIRSTPKKKIIQQLNEQYGISDLPYLLLQFGKEKIRLYSGSLSAEELNILDANLRIENMGLYFAKEQRDGIRLTLDGVQLIKNQITKNILKVDDEQAKEWLKGNDLLIKADNAFKIIKNNNEFLGCGKSTGEKITNFVPKERRIKD